MKTKGDNPIHVICLFDKCEWQVSPRDMKLNPKPHVNKEVGSHIFGKYLGF